MIRTSLAFAVLVLLPRVANAGACAQPSLFLFPPSQATLPTNAELRVVLYQDEVFLHDEVSSVQGSAPATTMTFALRQDGGATIPLERKSVPTSAGISFVLAPARPLVANASYVLVANGTTTTGPDAGKPHAFPVARYTAAAGVDTAAPSLVVRAAHYAVRTKRRGNTKGQIYGPFVIVTVTPSPGDEPLSSLLFEVKPEGGDENATFWKIAGSTELTFGAVGQCGRVDVQFPRRGKVRYELRAVDASGQRSAPVFILVDVDHPVKRP
jgi:hypothetical protein